MDPLSVTLIQTFLHWEDPVNNLEHFRRLLDRIDGRPDLILLPEMFNTGFSINPRRFAETMEGPSLGFIREQAALRNSAIMATLLIRDQGFFYNRLICVFPDGRIQTYDKRHLFRLSEEYRIIHAGNKKSLIEIKGWKLMPMICYDLRFPVWSKNTYDNGQYAYDALICLANWPESRNQVWETLLKARAIENQVFSIGVNRIGEDGHGTNHTGESLVGDAKGNVLKKAASGKEAIETILLSGQDLQIFRDSFTVGMDWDRFTLDQNEEHG